MPTPWDACGEDGSYAVTNNNGSYNVDTNAAHIRSPLYARSGINFVQQCTGIRPWPKGPLSSGSGMSFVWCNADQNSGVWPFWGLVDSNGVQRIYVELSNSGDGPDGPFNVYKKDASGTSTLLGATTGGFHKGPGSPDRFDYAFNYSAEGSLQLWINGVEVFSYTGDITTDSLTEVNGTFHSAWSPGYGDNITWSEIYASGDASSLAVDGVITSYATGAGTEDQWDGVYTNVSAETVNDANYDSTLVANNVQRYEMSSISNTNTIIAVFTELRCAQTELDHIALDQKVSGTEYTTAGQVAPALMSAPGVQFFQAESPATGLNWTVAELSSGFESGYKSLS